LKTNTEINKNTHDRELHVGWSVSGAKFVNIFNPLVVILEAIGRNSNKLNIALGKIIGTPSDLA